MVLSMEMIIDDELSHIVNMCQLQPTSRIALSFLKDRINNFKIGIIANKEWVTHYIDQDFHKQFRYNKHKSASLLSHFLFIMLSMLFLTFIDLLN